MPSRLGDESLIEVIDEDAEVLLLELKGLTQR
jgi:hypothetical protein